MTFIKPIAILSNNRLQYYNLFKVSPETVCAKNISPLDNSVQYTIVFEKKENEWTCTHNIEERIIDQIREIIEQEHL